MQKLLQVRLQLELEQHLSPNRANGLFHMMERIRLMAQDALGAEAAKAKP